MHYSIRQFFVDAVSHETSASWRRTVFSLWGDNVPVICTLFLPHQLQHKAICVDTVNINTQRTVNKWFLTPTVVGGRPPIPPEICVQCDPPPVEHHNFDQYPLIALQPWELATRFPTSHRWTVYVTLIPPKGGTKRNFAVLPVKFNFCRKKSATHFLCVKTSSGKVVAMPFPYLTVHRWIAGDVPV